MLNDPKILYKIFDEHTKQKPRVQASKTKKQGNCDNRDIFEIAEEIPISDVINDFYPNCSYRQRGYSTNIINHDFGNKSSFFVYHNTNTFCDFARTNSKGGRLGGGVTAFLREVVGLELREVAEYVENKKGLDSKARKKAYFEKNKSNRRANADKQDTSLTFGKETLNIKIVMEILKSALFVDIKFNVIRKQLDFINLETGDFVEALSMDFVATYIHSEFYSVYKNCSFTSIERYLAIIVNKNQYNPVLELLNKTKYDGSNQLSKVYKSLKIPDDDTLSRTLIKKWLWQGLSLLRNSQRNLVNPAGVLILQGMQNAGKTTFFRRIASINGDTNLYKEGASLVFSNKDTIIEALSYFVTELGEIGSTMKSDVDNLKAFLTSAQDTYRVPYGRTAQKYLRTTNFCGSVNDEKFLLDDTGSRRFWVVPISGYVDREIINSVDTLQLYKQIDEEAKHDLHGFNLTFDELEALQKRNKQYDKPMKAEEEILDILLMCENEKHTYRTTEMTVTAWKEQFSVLDKYHVDVIAKALTKIGIKQNGVKRVDGKASRLRSLPKRTQYPH